QDVSFYVTVDSYERAFIYSTTLGSSDDERNLVLESGTALRVKARDFVRSGRNFPLALGLEVDNAPANTIIEIELDRAGRGESKSERTLLSDREQQVRFSAAGPDGAMQFEMSVKDWQVQIPTNDLSGKRKLRVTLVDKNRGAILQKVEKEISFDNTEPEGRII